MADLLVRNIPDELKQRLADFAEREERSMAWVVRRALEEFLGSGPVPSAMSRVRQEDPPVEVQRLPKDPAVGGRSSERPVRPQGSSGCLHPPLLRNRGVCKGCGETVK